MWATSTDQTYSENESDINTIISIRSDEFKKIQILEEKKAYDIQMFGADVGGTLGLFIGFSILSVYDSFEQALQKYFVKYKSRSDITCPV